MNESQRSRLVSRFFSRTVIEDIARRGTAVHVARELINLGVRPVKRLAVIADLFDASLRELELAYRCEYVYKSAIASRIVFGRHSPRTSSLAIELGVANSIVDVAVFNGTSTAYEIKTEYDSHRRLSTQAPSYLRAFERVYVVTHPNLVEHYASIVDKRIGILCLTNKDSLREVRQPVSDVTRIEPNVIYRMLRRQEFMDAVHEHFGPQPKLPNGLVNKHYQKLFHQLTSEQAHAVFVAAMRSRTTDEETVEFVSALPKSLRALAYATPLSRPKRLRLLDALSSTF